MFAFTVFCQVLPHVWQAPHCQVLQSDGDGDSDGASKDGFPRAIIGIIGPAGC